MASSFPNLNSLYGTAPIASSAPVTSSGVNPSTGATYSKVQKTPAAGTAPTGGATLAPTTPNTPYKGPNGETYNPGTYDYKGMNTYNGGISAGNGTYGALGTNAPTGGIGNVSGATPTSPSQTTGPAPGAADAAAASAAAGTAGSAPTYGTQSGPGTLNQWFGERATGTDPAYEYLSKRGLTSLDNAASARGGYNGGASMQQDSDYLSNLGAQDLGNLDKLAAGASGENATSLNTMLGLGMGLAGGQAGLGGAYDLGGANAMSGANNAGLGYGAQGTALGYGANQNLMNQLFGLGSLAALA